MLVLGRKEGESLLIGQDIVITILKTRGGCIRIGIDAPKNILILREELAKKESKKPCSRD
jgi:carbon storage regulator